MSPDKRLLKAIDLQRDASAELTSAAFACFKIGRRVMWTHGKSERSGKVVFVTPCRVKIKSDLSGKEMWVNIYRLADHLR